MKWEIALKLSCVASIILFLLIPICLYFYQFGYNGLSSDSSDWGNFGDYLNGTIISILTIINTIVLYKLSRTANRIQEQSTKMERKHIIFQPHTDKINMLLLEIQFKYSCTDTQQSIKLLSILGNQFEEFVNEIKTVFQKEKENYSFIVEQKSKIKSKIEELKINPGNTDLLCEIFKEKYILFDKINENYNL
jgi:hypothetical protein